MAAVAAAPPVVKVVGLSGSLRKDSFSSGLLRAAIEISKSIAGLEIEDVDISLLPLLNTDLDKGDRYPDVVEAFRQKIQAADSVLFCSPEYCHSVTGALKNAIDWGWMPPNVWAEKTAAIVSTGSEFRGHLSEYALRQMGVFVDLYFINRPQFFLNVYEPPSKFDEYGNVTDPVIKERLKEILLSLQAFTLRLQGKSA